MLEAIPQSIFSWDYTVYRGSELVAEIDMSWFRERAEVRIAGQPYSVHRENMLQGTFELQSAGQVLARARKTSVFAREFEVDCAGRRLTLRAIALWNSRFALFNGSAQIGSVRPAHWLGRKAWIDFPADLSLPVQIFLFWLVLVLWRRAANSN